MRFRPWTAWPVVAVFVLQRSAKDAVTTAYLAPSLVKRHVSPSTTTRLHVFERMSEDCISALVTAQEQAASFQLETVGCEVMMVGVIDHPETPALTRTLKQYGLSWRLAQTSLQQIYRNGEDKDTANNGWLSGFRAAKAKEDRPLSPPLKKTLVSAGKLADRMTSTTVTSEHVFLALLEYSETNYPTFPTAVKEPATNGAWTVLQNMNALDHDVTPLDLCQTLLRHMRENQTENKRELVTGQGRTAKTPTLAECGIDLTEQARDGLLDPVYGRDAEIRSCVRTLIRRRKNNVCLIGDAGVGKVSAKR
jgi:ATP-dependent Clp protease ATP-binding subunit ClpA